MARIARTAAQKKAAARRNAQRISVSTVTANAMRRGLVPVDLSLITMQLKVLRIQEIVELSAIEPDETRRTELDALILPIAQEIEAEIAAMFDTLKAQAGELSEDLAAAFASAELEKEQIVDSIFSEIETKGFALKDIVAGTDVAENLKVFILLKNKIFFERIPELLANISQAIDDFTIE